MLEEDEEDGAEGMLQLRGSRGAEGYERFRRYVAKNADKVSLTIVGNAGRVLGNVPEGVIPRMRNYLEAMVGFGQMRTLPYGAFLVTDTPISLTRESSPRAGRC